MTFTLLKSRRTTHRSMLRWTWGKGAGISAGCLLLSCLLSGVVRGDEPSEVRQAPYRVKDARIADKPAESNGEEKPESNPERDETEARIKRLRQPPPDGDAPVEPEKDPKKLKKISEISPFGPPPDEGELPSEVSLGDDVYGGRLISHMNFNWEASDNFYNPLYFEDIGLERYGHTYPFVIQPVASIAKFTGQFFLLPYQMTINPVRKEMYPLGYHLPGDFVPHLWYPIPWNTSAALVEAGVATGLVFLIP